MVKRSVFFEVRDWILKYYLDELRFQMVKTLDLTYKVAKITYCITIYILQNTEELETYVHALLSWS
jgi:hypothetical protein